MVFIFVVDEINVTRTLSKRKHYHVKLSTGERKLINTGSDQYMVEAIFSGFSDIIDIENV